MTCRLSATRPASWSAGSADATQEEDVTSRRRVSSAETRLIMNSLFPPRSCLSSAHQTLTLRSRPGCCSHV